MAAYVGAALAALLVVGVAYRFWPARPHACSSRAAHLAANVPEPRGTIAVELPDVGAGAEIVLDNERILQDRLAPLDLTSGPHRLQVTGTDIDPVDHEFVVEPGENARLAIHPVYYGHASVTMKDTAGLRLRVDGATVEANRPLRLRAGVEHRLEVTGPDIDRVTRTFSV